MRQRTVGVVHIEGAAGAALLPIGAEHEMVDDELALAVEEIGEANFAVRAIEYVILFDFYPGKLAPFGADCVLQVREFFFFLQKLFASGKPRGLRDDFGMLWDCFATGHFCSPYPDSFQRCGSRDFCSTIF